MAYRDPRPFGLPFTVRLSAIHDLLACLALAIPPLASLWIAATKVFEDVLGTGGIVVFGNIEWIGGLPLQAFGIIGCLWAIYRLWRPTMAVCCIDLAVRLYVIWSAFALINSGATILALLIGNLYILTIMLAYIVVAGLLIRPEPEASHA